MSFRVSVISGVFIATTLGSSAQAESSLSLRQTEARPVSVALDNGFGAPSGIFGASIQYQFDADWGWYFGAGIGATGLQFATLGRYAIPLEGGGRHSLMIGVGPSLAVRTEAIGFDIENGEDVEVGHDDMSTPCG